jgi:hypothetical protein
VNLLGSALMVNSLAVTHVGPRGGGRTLDPRYLLRVGQAAASPQASRLVPLRRSSGISGICAASRVGGRRAGGVPHGLIFRPGQSTQNPEHRASAPSHLVTTLSQVNVAPIRLAPNYTFTALGPSWILSCDRAVRQTQTEQSCDSTRRFRAVRPAAGIVRGGESCRCLLRWPTRPPPTAGA